MNPNVCSCICGCKNKLEAIDLGANALLSSVGLEIPPHSRPLCDTCIEEKHDLIIFCGKCGKQSSLNDNFCSKCGNKLEKFSDPEF